MKRGVVYACSDPQRLNETLVSAFSCRRTMPDVQRELYCTSGFAEAMQPKDKKIFHRLEVIEEPRFEHRPRFDIIDMSALDQIVSIDSDTFFVEPVYELFDALEHYDFIGSAAPQHIHPEFLKKKTDRLLPKVSSALSELNAGMLAFRPNEEVRQLFNKWAELFAICLKNDYAMDQASLRIALAVCPVKINVVSDIYNFRANMPQMVRRNVKILHAHGDLKAIAQTINQKQGQRFYTPDPNLIHGYKPKDYDPKKSILRR